MEAPSTPQRLKDPIEDIKQLLSTEWGLGFPARPIFSSPSERNRNAVDEKIYSYIHFLYYSKLSPDHAALHYAIALFRQEARVILSQWQSKPHAEAGVIPTRQDGTSLGFLHHHRDELDGDTSRDLVQRLECILGTIADKVKSNQPYESPALAKMGSLAGKDRVTNSASASKRPIPHQVLAKISGRDSTPEMTKALHFSSDDFPDDEIHSILQSHPLPNENYELAEAHRTAGRTKAAEDLASATDEFVTSPTSPSQSRSIESSRMPSALDFSRNHDFLNPPFFDLNNKKRERAESPSPLSRKSSRGVSEHIVKPTANILSFTEQDPMVGILAGPPQPFGHMSTVPSMMTPASSFMNSTYTSFATNTQNTSFDSLQDQSEILIPNRTVPWSLQSDPRSYLTLSPKNDSSSNIEITDDGNASLTETMIKATDNLGLANQKSRSPPDLDPNICVMSPFVSSPLVKQATVPFRQIYEICRVAQSSNIGIKAFSTLLSIREDNYVSLWSLMSKILKTHNRTPPEQSSLTAWNKAVNQFHGVSLSAKLTYSDSSQLSTPVFDIQFLPMKMEMSRRLSRHFGGDRFLLLAIPGFSMKDLPACFKGHAGGFRDAFVKWIVTESHHIFGREWRAFYVNSESSKKKRKGTSAISESKFRVYLFAEDGHGFEKAQMPTNYRIPGEIDERISPVLHRMQISVQQMIEWLIPLKQNQNQQSLKSFHRLRLGLTSTYRTVTFTPSQIIRSDDAFADSPCERRLDSARSDAKKKGQIGAQNSSSVMNDGCARISRLAAVRVAAHLALGYIPSIFQGRIGGAKGVWMVDALDETADVQDTEARVWIEITDSQQKFESSPINATEPDPDQVTLDVNAWSKGLIPGFMNFQFIPILKDRGVPSNVFKELLMKDLYTKTSDLEDAMEDGLALRKWCHSNFPTTGDRLNKGGIEMLGGLPESKMEKIVWFIDHGFQAKACGYLRDLLFLAIKDHCLRLEDRMHIGLELSTNAFMVADPLNVLEENEVHIGFSRPFKDDQGFDQFMLHNVNVLVARLPAYLPSDIQKVRAVFKPELGVYRDVIVFSSRGETSLASKLSGGDYDGDKAWVCWEDSLVEWFQNATVPEEIGPEFFGIEKDTTKVSDILQERDILQEPNYVDRFLSHSFDVNLRHNMLGVCTKFREALCYTSNTIDFPEATQLALLSGHLVDGPKNGLKFGDSEWAAFRKKLNLLRELPIPAYKDRSKGKPTDNLIDDLVFSVTRKVREDILGTFNKNFKDVETWDDDLFRLHSIETEEAKSDQSLDEAMERLTTALEEIMAYWKANRPRGGDNDDGNFFCTTKRNDPPVLSFNAAVEECRERFLAIPPYPLHSNPPLPLPSPRLQQWSKSHTLNLPSYWDLLKASVAFRKYHKWSPFIWYMAGVELGELKVTAGGSRAGYRTVVMPLYEVLKPDGRMIDAVMGRGESGVVGEERGVGEEEEEEEEEEDFWELEG